MSNHYRQRGRRPTSPASSSSASSASSDDEDSSHLTLVGTPIDATERHYRILRQQRQQRQTRPEAAGFTPAAFVSTRQRRWQGEAVTVEEYMDNKDVSEQTRERLQVKADIEGGGTATRQRGEDAVLLAIAPRHETVARRIVRRMGWREGGGVGGEKQAGSSSTLLTRVNRARRRPTVAAALPPSMQALLDEDDEETQLAAHNQTPTHVEETKANHNATADIDDDDEDDDVPLPSDVPLFQPSNKDDFYGLGYDPLHNADEFLTHKTKQLQDRRRREEEARDTALMHDDYDDDVVELVRGGAGRGSRGGRAGRRGGGVAGFRVMNDDEMEDDDVEVYEDRSEYDTHIGRLKRDKRKEQSEQKEEPEATAGANGELVFVKGEVGGVSDIEAASAWVVPRDWNERKVWDEAEEATERARMKAVVRDWADRRRAQLRARQNETRLLPQRNDETKESDERSQQRPPALPQPLPPAPPPPVQSTADMLASGFFSRFTMAASTASPILPSLPMPPPPPPTAPSTTSPIRQLKREVLVWDPSPLLCRRLGVEPPPRRETATKLTTEQLASRTSNNQPANKQKRRQRQHDTRAATESGLAEAEAAQLRAPVFATDRPPTAVLSAIFDDVDDRGDEQRARTAQQQWLEAEAMRLLASITLPSNKLSSMPASTSASAAFGLSFAPDADRSAVSGHVHPSRQQQVQSTSSSPAASSRLTVSTLFSPAPATQSSSSASLPEPSIPTSGYVHPSRVQQLPPSSHAPGSASSSSALTAPRRSRWGDRADTVPVPPPLPLSTLLSPSSSPPPLGPPTPPSLPRPLPPPAATPTAPTTLIAGSEQQKAALKAELLKELAMLERQSKRDEHQRRKEKRKERKRERPHEGSSDRSSSGRRAGDRNRERRHSRRSGRGSSSGSESGYSGSSVRTGSLPLGGRHSKNKPDVVDLT